MIMSSTCCVLSMYSFTLSTCPFWQAHGFTPDPGVHHGMPTDHPRWISWRHPRDVYILCAHHAHTSCTRIMHTSCVHLMCIAYVHSLCAHHAHELCTSYVHTLCVHEIYQILNVHASHTHTQRVSYEIHAACIPLYLPSAGRIRDACYIMHT